jgi:hypothetical protein
MDSGRQGKFSARQELLNQLAMQTIEMHQEVHA